MRDHFSSVAASYNDIRTTDLEPVIFVRDVLGTRESVRVADIGCGGGRYSLLLFQHLPGLDLTCVDVNASMLMATAAHLTEHGVEQFSTVNADIEHLQLPSGTLDAVLTFNAIHHFDPGRFLATANDALTLGGYLFIYTRLQAQNSRSIWGQWFPGFAETETRLYRLSDIEQWGERSGSLSLESINFFRYPRGASVDELLNQVRRRHYSTFSLYSAADLERATDEFERNVRERFPDPDRVEWPDENVMIVFRKNLVDAP